MTSLFQPFFQPLKARARRSAALALGLCFQAAAWAAEPPAPQGVASLSSSASAEVAKDLITVTLGTVRDGADASQVQSGLKQALDTALQIARREARPGQLEVQTGNFSLSPRYSNKGGITGWAGSAELVLEGRDMAAIAQLAGRLGTLTVSRVAYSLSRETREKAEADVSAQAIARFRVKSADVAQAFGYAGYALRDVNVSASEPSVGVPMLRARAMSVSSDEALPVEAGKALVTVSVNGSIQMTR